MQKGNLVRLNPAMCFTTDAGGGLRFPLTNYHNDENGTFQASRPITEEETNVWYDSDASHGMTSAGETKLPPQSVQVILHRDLIYHVVRARCRIRFGCGNPIPGMAELLCTHTGETAYVRRELLEVL